MEVNLDRNQFRQQKKQALEALYLKTKSLTAVSNATGLSVSGIYPYVKDLIRVQKEKRNKDAVSKNNSRQIKHQKASDSMPAVDSVINLSYRLEKFKIRKEIISTADTMLKDISAITFPGSEWTMERDLLLKCGDRVKNITALEKNPTIYKYSENNIPFIEDADRIEFLCVSDSELFATPAKRLYNLLWLDYMGPFLMSKLDSFKLALSNGYIADKSLVCLTFLNGRDSQMLNEYKGFADKNIPSGGGKYTNARLQVIPQMYATAAADYGFKTSVLSSYSYKERQGSVTRSPMLFIALKMEKQAGNVDTTVPSYQQVLKSLPATMKQIYSMALNKKTVRKTIRRLLKNRLITFNLDKISGNVIYSLTTKGKNLLKQED